MLPITAQQLHWKLVWLYVQGSLAAVAVTFFLVFAGLQFTLVQWIAIWTVAFIFVSFYMAIDVIVITRHFRPVGDALRRIEAQTNPSSEDVSRAIVRALNLPYLSFIRVTFVHGPLATGMLIMGMLIATRYFDVGYETWQVIAFAATVLFFASPAHAILEYFAIARIVVRLVEQLWPYCNGIEQAHQADLIAIRLRNKLLYLSVFIAALPLFFFAISIILKVDILFSGLGYRVSMIDMMPLLMWVVGVVLVCMGGALVMSILTASEVSRSAAKLVDAMRSVEQGSLDVTLRITGTDEYAELFRGFNLMTESLREEVRILEVSHDLAGELNLDTLLRRIIGATTELLDADRSTLLLHDPKTNELWSRVAEGLTTREIRMPATQGIAGAVQTTGKTENIDDPYADPRFNQAIDRQTGYRTRSILCMPIVNKAGKVLGVTQVLNKRNSTRFSIKDEARLGAFTAQIAVALENAQLFEDVLKEKNNNDSILRSTSNGMLTIDPAGRILTVNDAALQLLGSDLDTLVGRGLLDLLGHDNPWIAPLLDRVSRSSTQDSVIGADLRGLHGETANVNMSVMPLVAPDDEAIGSLLVIEDITAEKRVKTTMSRYMSAEVVDQLLAQGEQVLGGKDQHVSVMFSDLRNFTTASEALGARETVAMLNEYFEGMVDVIFKNKGVLDKYIGDAIMALYGAPFEGPEDAANSVRTAHDMFGELRKLNGKRAGSNMAPLDIGIGISTGRIIVGNIGSPKRMEYTVIGDSVNLASRLEGATKFYGIKLLLSEFTTKELPADMPTRPIDLMRVKGKKKPVEIFESLGYYDGRDAEAILTAAASYRIGYAAMQSRDWKEAIARFEAALKTFPCDKPAQLHLDRARFYLQNPPPGEWDGVWVMQDK